MHQTPADLKQRLGVFYKNLPAREYKFLISEPDFNFNTLKKLLVNKIAAEFGGGGHHAAAGARVQGKPMSVQRRVIRECRKAVDALREKKEKNGKNK